MAIVDTPVTSATRQEDGNVMFVYRNREALLHPVWLRHRSSEPGQIDATNLQRLFTPCDIDPDLTVGSVECGDDHVVVSFSDGHTARLGLTPILEALGWEPDDEEPPGPEAWTEPLADFPYVDWEAIGWEPTPASDAAMVDFLGAFFRHGYVVIRNTPSEPGTAQRVAERLGYLVGNNFGAIFDVRSEPNPTDLAYTAIKLLAHTDQPYRQPAPGIQMLHCIANGAPGGDSTLVDGLACYQGMQAEEPDLLAAMCATEVVYRYDMGSDTVVDRGFTFELDNKGRFTKMRFNTKLDEPVLGPDVDLDAYYAGRRWLAAWLNNPAHQVTFRLEPGDLMFMDNHRVLHGRTSFDASRGHRHLQGCYIERDRPDTLYRLAQRRLGATSHDDS